MKLLKIKNTDNQLLTYYFKINLHINNKVRTFDKDLQIN